MKQIVQDQFWRQRLDSGNRYYQHWESAFKCKILEEYYEGLQWKSQKELAYDPYVINKFYETIEIKIAEFVPTFPKFNVSARPANFESAQDPESAMNSAQLKEDVLNSIIQDTRRHFAEELEASYKDSFFRFGMLEVGYAADWILNPHAPKPLLKGDTQKFLSDLQKRKLAQEPKELPINERIYFKHIPAKNFRVGGIDNRYLDRCSWVGYFEYVNKDDLLALPKLMNRDRLKETNIETIPGDERYDQEDYDGSRNVKLWYLWDLRSYYHLMVIDSPILTIYQKKFDRLPLFDYRPGKRVVKEGFYPVPTCFNWLSPQNEINEIREMLRAHRRRFVRKFQVVEGMMDNDEIEKFETGPDGAIVKVKQTQAITPIENADLGQTVAEATATSGDDFNRITATSDQDRGVSDRSTATEQKIIETRGQIRQGKDRDRLAAWLAGFGREILLTVRDKFTLGIWTELTSPEGEPFLGEVQSNPGVYKWVTSEELNDGYDFRIDVDVTSMSSTAAAEEKQHFLEFLGVLTQFPMLAFSPILVREAAYRVGYRNMKAIRELQKMALLMEQGRMAQLQQQVGQNPQPENGNAGQQIVAQQTPPGAEQIRQQLNGQLVQ